MNMRKKYNEWWLNKSSFKSKRFESTIEHDARNQKFYQSKQWKQLRKYVLSMYPECQHCLKNERISEAIDVNHIVNINDDWNKRLDIDNLECLCKSCHWKVTRKEINEREKKLRDKKIKYNMDDLESHLKK